jgi:hypothetical protein
MSKQTGVFTPISEKLPKMGKQSAVSTVSGLVSLQTKSGKVVRGYIQRYETDMTAHHIMAKKGDLVIYDIENAAIADVTGWALID